MAKRTIVSSAQYWDFEKNPIFKGYYISEHSGKDSETGEDKVFGFNFSDQDGQEYLITNAWSIKKALDTVDDKTSCMVRDMNTLIEIEFIEKVENKKGRPFNRFKVSILD